LSLRQTQNFVIELVIVTNLLTSFKYGSLFEERTNLSENNNITIGLNEFGTGANLTPTAVNDEETAMLWLKIAPGGCASVKSTI
jgi:hypothetical protein